ncbi:MAG: AI-2E family transporter [Bacteroidetes bacterium]|nr:MAG: AI-2E family transporter [Bacteroidota bacterium]
MKNSNLLTIILLILGVFISGVILRELRVVLLPFTIALLLSIIFKPFVMKLKSKRLPMALSLFGVLLFSFFVMFLVGWIVFSSIQTFVGALPGYEARFSMAILDFQADILLLAERFDLPVSDFRWTNAIQLSSVTSVLTSGLGSFISFVSSAFLIVLFMLFILAGSGDLQNKIRLAFPETQALRIAIIVDTVDTRVRQYLVTKTLISLGTGLLTFLVLLALGVDFPLIWAVVAFVLNYIPSIGSIIAVLFPFTLSLLQFDSLGVPFMVILFLGVTQMLMGNVIEPRIMAFRLNLSPLLILVSLIFWGWLWGLLGMMLAVPLTATLKIIIENLQALKPLAILMSGTVDEKTNLTDS